MKTNPTAGCTKTETRQESYDQYEHYHDYSRNTNKRKQLRNKTVQKDSAIYDSKPSNTIWKVDTDVYRFGLGTF